MSDIFVATTGNDTTGDGSVGNPFLTVDKAQTVGIDNDVIKIQNGTYDEGNLKVNVNKTLTVESVSGDPRDVIITKYQWRHGSGTHTYTIKNVTWKSKDTGFEFGTVIEGSSGVFTLDIQRCVFIGQIDREVVQFGSGLNSSSVCTITNCIIDTTAADGRGVAVESGTMTVKNTILQNHNFAAREQVGDILIIENCCFFNNNTDTQGSPSLLDNIFVDPELEPDLSILTSSPCADAGQVVVPITDGFLGAAPDIGFFESAPNQAPTAPTNLAVVET